MLHEADQAVRHVYFPNDSFVSLIAVLDDHHGLAVGLTGSEGVLGAQLALGARCDPLKAMVQGAGTAWRVEAGAFRRELARSAPLRQCLLRYLSVLLNQRAVSAACLRFHEIGPRLARWLLMSQDRAHADHFAVTQDVLAAMLGVRRVGVTAAASALQRQGLIEYHRGRLTVLDRPGLEAASCACYAADRRVYARAMGAGSADGRPRAAGSVPRGAGLGLVG